MVSLASSCWTSFVSVQFRLLHFLSQIDGTLRIWFRVYMTMSVIVSVLKNMRGSADTMSWLQKSWEGCMSPRQALCILFDNYMDNLTV